MTTFLAVLVALILVPVVVVAWLMLALAVKQGWRMFKEEEENDNVS